MRVIAFAQQKGGVGKSALTINLSVELACRKYRVAVIDMDQQASVDKWRRRRDRAEPVVIHCDLRELNSVLTQFRNDGIDYVVIDLPGRRDAVANEVIKISDLVIIPSRPLDMDIEASTETIATVNRLRRKYAIVMSICPPRGARTEEFSRGLVGKGQPVMSTSIVERMDYPDAISEGLGVREFSPKGKAAREMSDFATEIERIVK